MFWVIMMSFLFPFFVALVLYSVGKAGNRVYVAWLDLVSYVLTTATIVVLVIATQSQISQIFIDKTGEDLASSEARAELIFFLNTKCGLEPECTEVAQVIDKEIALNRRAKLRSERVNTDVSRLPELAAFVARYNDAYDQDVKRERLIYASAGFWVSLAAVCGAMMGVTRRILVFVDALRSAKK